MISSENPDIIIRDGIVKIVDIPRGIISEDLIEKRLKFFAQKGFNVASCGNLAAVEIARKQGFKILADTGLNIANSESADTIKSMGAVAVTSSSELTLDDANISCDIPKGIIAYGNIPLMLFKNCPVKNSMSCEKCNKSQVLTDRLGIEFPIRCRMGYSEMLNSVPLWLADRKGELNGFDFLTIYFTVESKERATQVIEAYKRGLPPDVKHTRGLYYRGTI